MVHAGSLSRLKCGGFRDDAVKTESMSQKFQTEEAPEFHVTLFQRMSYDSSPMKRLRLA
jgi:hypothetical protein